MSIDTPPQDSVAATPSVSRKTVVILAWVGGGLLLVVFLLLLVLLRPVETPPTIEIPTASETATETPSPTPTESETPTPTPSPSPTATVEPSPVPTPTPTAAPPIVEEAEFISFVAPRVTTCTAGDAEVEEEVPLVTVAWNSTGAVEAWFVDSAEDAADAAQMQVPLQGDQDDFAEPQYFPCGSLSHKYTLTLVAADGSHESKTWTVLNKGDVFTPEPR